MLPAATAACAKVATPRLLTEGRRTHQPLDMTLGIAVFFAVELYIGHIARSTVRHKHHIIVHSGYGIALSSHSRYLNSLKQR